MSLQTKVIGRTPTDHGPYNPNKSYGKKFCVTLFGCMWESLHDNNNTAPAVWDGGDTITPNLVDWKKVSGDYNAWLMNQNKPAQSVDYPFNGMGRVKLLKHVVDGHNLLYQDDFYKDGPNNTRVPNTNTVFEVPYEFELAEDITIPDNCVLMFNGGSLNGTATLTFSNTELKGTYAGISHTLNLAGTIKGLVDVGFWDIKFNDNTYDNGVVINKVCGTFKRIYVPSGTLYFTTPLVMEDMGRIECDAILSYHGGGSNLTAVKVRKSNGIINFNESIINDLHDNSYPVYTTTNNSKIIGLETEGVNGCEIRFFNIVGFNEGLRVSNIDSGGCSYNTFYLGTIWDANYHVRVYQRNKDNQAGNANWSWCNQNIFMGGRMSCYSSWSGWEIVDNTKVLRADVPCYCFYFKGGLDDGLVDTYNLCNNITIIGTSVEVNNNANFYLNNCSNFRIYNTRSEGASKSIKCVGDCTVDYKPGYGNKKVDLSDSLYMGVKNTCPIISLPISDTEWVEISEVGYVNRYLKFASLSNTRFAIKYLEDENGAISDADRASYPTIGSMYYNPSFQALLTASDQNSFGEFAIPSTIKKIAVKTNGRNAFLSISTL